MSVSLAKTTDTYITKEELQPGDKIVEYDARNKRTVSLVKTVKKHDPVELSFTCSKHGVHVNGTDCYTSPLILVER